MSSEDSTEEARQMVFEKYRAKLLNDDEITQHIVGYREVYIAFDEDGEYGFLDLPKVAGLTEESQAKLIEKIAGQKVPYAVAMFDYIGFIKHLQDNYFKTLDQLYRMISKFALFGYRR